MNETITKDKESIMYALQVWVRAVESGNVQEALSLYHPKAVLSGAFSKTLRDHPAAIGDYFEHFLAFEDLKVNVVSVVVRGFDEVSVITGFYNFTHILKEKRTTVNARFSFTYVPDEKGHWLIVDHHSSVLPQKSY